MAIGAKDRGGEAGVLHPQASLADRRRGGQGESVFASLIIVDNNLGSRHGDEPMISADLGTQLEGFVTKLVETGRYNSKSEVLREGVRLVQEREARLAALDASIARGLDDAAAGRTRPADAVSDGLDAKYRGLVYGVEQG